MRKQSGTSCAVERVAVRLCVVVALLAASFPLSLFSQSSTGTIQGGVFDSSGGAIAGARVTITDVARGTTRTLTSDESGQYVAPSLTTGSYTVRGENGGFRTVERSNVKLEVGQIIRIDLTLAPGEQTQTLTVTEEVPAIDTTSATLGGTVSNNAIQALPLNGRNFMRLLELRPGVVNHPGDNTSASSTNGRRSGADILVIDGTFLMDMTSANNLVNGSAKGSSADSSSAFPVDAIQEFHTEQNAPAEAGWKDGSVINVGIKSGTNSLHGTAFAFGRDAAATDAANPFTQAVNPATLEQFGATAGGRIIKDKVFWFVGFEGLRVEVGNPSPVTVPSSIGLAPADPNFSMVDACNAVKQGLVSGPTTISPLSARLAGLDPVTCKVSPETDSFENVFPYNPTTSKVFYPGTLTNQPLNNGVAKGDWQINDRHHLTGYYFNSTSTQIAGGGMKSYWNTTGYSKTVVVAGGWTWIPNSSWVNDLRVGWGGSTASGNPGDSNRMVGNPWPNGYGLPTGVTDPEAGGFPLINFAGSSGGGGGSTTTGIITGLGVPGTTGTRGPQGQLNIKDSVSYLRGNHAFKFGFEHVWVKFNNSTSTDARGQLDFPSLTSFLQGLPDSGLIRSSIQLETDRARWYAAFVQDTWRITHRLTVTPGLRYEYQGAPHDIYSQLGTFDPSVPGGIAQVGSGLPHSSLYSPEKLGFFPRLGFAWDTFGNGRTVLRGGVSLMSGTIPMTGVTQQTPFGSTMCTGPCTDASGNLIPANIVVNRFGTDINKTAPQQLSFAPNQLKWDTTGPIFPVSGAAGSSCTIAVPCVTGAPDPNYKRPKAVEWDLDIQRAITNRLTIDVAYVGNHGYDEFGQVDLNVPPLDAGCTGTCTTQSIAAATANSAAFKAACAPDANAINAARPYNTQFPYLSYIERSTGSLGIFSNYDALQVTVDQRNFHGLSFLSGYTYSHGLDISSTVSRGVRQMVDPTNPRLTYGSGDNDVRHTFRISPTWMIPGIKAPGQMLEGWSISGILTLQGRFPYSALDNRKNDWIGTGETNNTFVSSGVTQFWNFSGPTDAFNSSNVPIPCYGRLPGCKAFASAPADIQTACNTAAQAPYSDPTLQKLALLSLANNGCYIQNGGVLTPPAYGTIGNAGKNSFRGPQYKNVDMSVTKDWHIRERYGAQFRVEFFNVFNRADYGAPGSNPTSGGASFGFSQATPDASNAVFGSGGPRHVQFGLKLTF
jgi:hypothetical protein